MTEPSVASTPTPVATPVESGPAGLYLRWQELLAREGKLRIRAAADALGVSELELRLSQLARPEGAEPEVEVTRLVADWPKLIEGLPALGEVMALTRNPSAVHEKVGRYDEISFGGGFGLVLNHDIDLRLFMKQWTHGVAVREPAARGGGTHRSLQFFDAQGTAIHKIYMREGSDLAAYDALIAAHRAPEAPAGVELEPAPAAEVPKPDEDIDAAAFQAEWLALEDTHDFFPMLRRHGVARTQALRLAPEGHAERVPNDSIVHLLGRAAETETSIMVFVGNRGCIQIHTGPVARVAPTGPWINVLDPGFNLHLRTDAVSESWIVRKPTVDGMVNSLELFDDQGETIALLFGERKPGKPELDSWRDRLDELPR